MGGIHRAGQEFTEGIDTGIQLSRVLAAALPGSQPGPARCQLIGINAVTFKKHSVVKRMLGASIKILYHAVNVFRTILEQKRLGRILTFAH